MSTAARLLDVLGLFTFDTPEWTAEAVAKELNLSLSTAYRYFKHLSDAGLIVAYAPGRYVVGPAITQLDRQTRLRDPLISIARPLMRQALEELSPGAVLLLCRLYRDQVMCVHQETRTPHPIAISYERGKLMPLYRGAASKIILASLPARQVQRHYRLSGGMDGALGGDWEEVKRALRKLRSAGLAITHAELDPGMVGVAAPLFTPDGDVIGSLGLVLPESGGENGVSDAAVNVVKSYAADINAVFREAYGDEARPRGTPADDQTPS